MGKRKHKFLYKFIRTEYTKDIIYKLGVSVHLWVTTLHVSILEITYKKDTVEIDVFRIGFRF